MTQSEQKELDLLREQLMAAQTSETQVKSQYASALGRMTGELRLYRGLFWCLLACSTMAVIARFLDR
jgi:hypothetical protein